MKERVNPPAPLLDLSQSSRETFIETQFPVSRLSKESYKERKANYSQTLTGLGKWWGRKPLVMVRAIILGLLMPASNDPRKDREVFLALLTMDEEGLWRRKSRNIPLKEVYGRLSPEERAEWFADGSEPDRPRLRKGAKAADRARLQRIVFERMGYDEKLRWCDRPEHLEGPSPDAWKVINRHLGTKAASLPELVRALGERRFGRVPRVGDAFCGGGSVPFEAARLGCEAYGSDLNPVAALLTWGALNIVGGGEEVAERIRAAQTEVFEAVDRQITAWRIEHDEAGWRADAFLYCTETACPECGWRVPLAPSWVIGEKTRAVARLRPEPAERRFAIDIRSGVDREALAAARNAGTVKQSRLECPNLDCRASTPMTAIRGDRRGDGGRGHGLRQWENDDLVPRPDDVFQERLYCVRWRLPSLAALLWAEQRSRAACRLENHAGGPPGANQGTRFPEGQRRKGPAGGKAMMPEAVRVGIHASAPPGADQDTPLPRRARRQALVGGGAMMPEVARQDVHAEGTPPHPDAPLSPVLDWVDLDCAITALVEGLEADEQREVTKLRSRDWPTEDRAVEEARREFETQKGADCSKGELTAAARRFKQSREAADRRNDRVEALAKSLPEALYLPVGDADLEREARALALLRERFPEWQALGYIPNRAITPGDETTRLMRERGWTHWHHLFTPRQLLVHGALAEKSQTLSDSAVSRAAYLLGLGRVADWNSRLSRWWTDGAHEKVIQTFSNQALNTLMTFGSRGIHALADSWYLKPSDASIHGPYTLQTTDARAIDRRAEIWITDPPYADAINYHELSEFFLAWYEKSLPALFRDWYSDSKRALAVRGADADFRRSMVACYRNLADHMPDDGLQVVMFTHQDASIWADLTLILWAAGLRVTAAWTVATETPFGVKEGNYVQGTVLMVLRKQTTGETAFLDEVVPEVEAEVERQLASMLELDDREDPNFSDADYQLAAYAAALRVLTQYGSIEDIDVSHELSRERRRGEPNPIEKIIGDAVRTASNFRVPAGLPKPLWRGLAPDEKLYLKGLDIEQHGDFRSGVYQEFARGFGVRDYRDLLHTGKANRTRLKTASEFGRRDLGDSAFGRSLVRHALYAVWRAAESGEVADSLTWLRAEMPDYWPQREALAAVLRYLAAIDGDHWREDAAGARLVAGAVENDHV